MLLAIRGTEGVDIDRTVVCFELLLQVLNTWLHKDDYINIGMGIIK